MSVRKRELVEQHADLLTVPRALAQFADVDGERNVAHEPRIWRFRNTRSRASPRFCRCLGGSSSRCSKISSSVP